MDSGKDRILIFSLSYFPLVGGAEIAVREITQRISTNEIEWDMVTLRFDMSHPEFERIGNVNVHRIGGGSGYFSKILFIPQAARFAVRRHYRAYWCMMTYMLFPAALLRLIGRRTPYILTLQDGDPFEHVFARARIFPFLPFLLYGFRHAAKVQAISNYLAEWAVKMGYRGKVEVVPNGVDIEKFTTDNSQSTKNSDETILITTSRLVKKNAVGDVIEALKFLPETVKFRIAGTGPLEESLKLKVRSLKLENRVEFLGEVSHYDISKYLHEADMFVRPSLSEGQGISFIEAMAARLPVIATPVGGIPDFLKHDETGLFCEPSNPESIAEQVKRLLEDSDLRASITTNARKMVEDRYDWDLIAKEMKGRVFNEAIEE